MEDQESYDAVVVGSGYGGSVAVCRLAMAGIKACLIEKGRRWEAVDFPTNSHQLLSAVRMDLRNWGLDFGSKDALFQIHIQGDSLTGVACGLGGGSLVNAGVMASTPGRTRKNPKWPKEWENDWDACEASALEMLRSHNVPFEFPSATVMREIAEDIEDMRPNPFKLTMNFGGKDDQASTGSDHSLGSCLACGNCISGCPYDAKNSTDKNYLARAVQAGCIVKTGRSVRFVVKNREEDYDEPRRVNERKKRWRVYFDDFEYVCADFVVLSAGVLGTTEILFQSQRRGLRLSQRLGFGLSCNGNNVAYVAGSRTPTQAYGLSKKQLSQVPFDDRPGPAISSSYTSSLGFTIQNGVLPTSYPYLLFKGICTYGWPSRYWFLHGLIDKLKHMMGLKGTQAMVLNMMGYDEADGRVTLDENTEKICFKPPRDPLLPRKIQVLQRLTRRLGGILFMSRFRSSSVHLLGGCNAASNPSNGVCNHDGQVFDAESPPASVNQGLYVCDASLIPCPVGVNPCLTIAAAAEHVSRHLAQEVLRHKSSIELKLPKGPQNSESVAQMDNIISPTSRFNKKLVPLTDAASVSTKKVTIKEILKGYVGGMPCTAYLTMRMNCKNRDHHAHRDQTIESMKGEVRGYVVLPGVEKDKLYIIDGKVDMCNSNRRTPYTQYMTYHLLLVSSSGSRYYLEGKKTMNPYLLGAYAWKESRTLNIRLKDISSKDDTDMRQSLHPTARPTDLQGELYLSPFELLRSLITMTGTNKRMFIFALLKSLLWTYILQIPRSQLVEFGMKDVVEKAYPLSVSHKLKSGDGVTISCRQWNCNQNAWKFEGKTKPYPVLLINGHATESFCLPTEPTDLVRTLIEAGYETWLLQPRLHPLHPSNNFTIEDIGKFDIPAVVEKIKELHGSSVKLHVVAHCVGGLAIHIALMGGHISSTQIASLSCTNSSMFFRLTTSSLVKMRLPLIPISMAILGKHTILAMLQNSEDSFRHRCLKQVARLIPRYERCTCEECEVFSGIFGNAFWHNNISDKLHYWLNKHSLPRLPLSAFPHLRKICLSGFIVDSKGRNAYLMHPERMAVPTLYISGGSPILVTPQTSLLAHQYMRLHQPAFRHKRLVLEGFGHSDLLIGEESHKKVFPHILSHIEMAEQGKGEYTDVEQRGWRKESLSWSNYREEDDGFGVVSSLLLFSVFLLMGYLLFLLFF